MPDDRLARARRSLPEGYQFGDARSICDYTRGSVVRCRDGSQVTVAAPVRFDANHVHDFTVIDFATLSELCACGARRDRVEGAL